MSNGRSVLHHPSHARPAGFSGSDPGNGPAPARLANVLFMGTSRVLSVDFTKRTCQSADPRARVTGPFDKPTFRRWLTAGAANPGDPDLLAYADTVFTVIATTATQATAGDSLTRHTGAYTTTALNTYTLAVQPNTPSTSTRGHPRAEQIITTFWAVVWLGGLAILYHRTRPGRASTITTLPSA